MGSKRKTRGDTLVESRKNKTTTTMFHKKAGTRWTYKNPNCVTKTEIDTLAYRPDIVTDVTVNNQVNIGSDHRMVMRNIKLYVEVERNQLMPKKPSRIDTTQIGSQKIEFQLELRNRLETRQELDDIDTMRENITGLIQQSATKVAKAFDKPLKSRISSPTRALMTKRNELVGIGDDKQRLEYAEICKKIKKKSKENTRKYNLEIIRETFMASKSLKKATRTQTLGQYRRITLLDAG